MDLLLFCEWLIHRRYFAEDYAAEMTLSGILYFVNLSKHMALKDSDMEEYKKYAKLSDTIQLMRDRARLAAKESDILEKSFQSEWRISQLHDES